MKPQQEIEILWNKVALKILVLQRIYLRITPIIIQNQEINSFYLK
jgi:hypothetical protein